MMKEDIASKLDKVPKSDKAEIVIIRHGSTRLNSADKIRGWLDLPLDDDGKAEAKKLGKKLENTDIYGLISSDMKRAVQTAEIISRESGIPILKVDKAFRPWNVGIHANKPNVAIPEGESFNTFKDRFLDGLIAIQKKYKGKCIGIVTHHRGDRIMAAWEKCGMPASKKVDLSVMFQKGIEPGTYRCQGEKIETNKTPD